MREVGNLENFQELAKSIIISLQFSIKPLILQISTNLEKNGRFIKDVSSRTKDMERDV